jgi:hypothetical protein
MSSSTNPYFNNSQNITYWNTNDTHDVQQNTQQYFKYNKFVSIHSEDRNMLAYPNASQFEIELPEDITNISMVKLMDWTFPANYSIFSIKNGNITFAFSLTNIYQVETNPTQLQIAIYNALNSNINHPFVITIEEGFYNPDQMTNELTNKMNEIVSDYITDYLTIHNDPIISSSFTGYKRFKVVYNAVSMKIWFGNYADQFIVLNELIDSTISLTNSNCIRNQFPDFSNWGLPENIGFQRCNLSSTQEEIGKSPRFYYGDVAAYGDNGYWINVDSLDTPGSQISYLECPNKINLFGPSHIYLIIQQLNCLDVTAPFSVSTNTLKTNQTNGLVNYAFAKIALCSTPISQIFDKNAPSYKFFEPPLDRIRKLQISLRYHNNQLVDFGTFNYSFTLDFTQLIPMKKTDIKIVNY